MTCIVTHTDCMDPVYGLPSLEDQGIDHVITDPPFEAEAHTLQRRVVRIPKAGGRKIESEPLAFGPITDELRALVALEVGRIVRRWALVFCQIEAIQKWTEALVAAGLVYKRTCIWRKPDGMPQYSGDRPGMGYETFVVCHAGGRSRWNGGGKHGVYTHRRQAGNVAQKNAHPTQKPLALMEELVRDFTDPGDRILDPFAGSGTTLVAAKRYAREGIGMERDEKYAKVARDRIAATSRDLFATETVEPQEQLTILDE